MGPGAKVGLIFLLCVPMITVMGVYDVIGALGPIMIASGTYPLNGT